MKALPSTTEHRVPSTPVHRVPTVVGCAGFSLSHVLTPLTRLAAALRARLAEA